MSLRHIVLLAGVAIAGWFAFFGDKTATADIAEPVTRAASASSSASAGAAAPNVNAPKTSATVPAAAGERATTILALQARDTLIWDKHNLHHADTLFNSQSWTPPPPPPPKIKMAPPPPMAPPLAFTYLGKKIEDGVWEVYLARGEKTFIVRAQSDIEGNYRVDSILPPTLSLTYLPLKQVQRLTIGGAD